MKKMDSDSFSYIESALMGLIGLIAWFYAKTNGVVMAEGMKLTKILSIMFLIIGVVGYILSKYFTKKPLKSVGVVNKDDELFTLIRAKSAQNTLKVINIASFLFIILTATEILKIKISMYYLGIIFFVSINVLSIIFNFVQSRKVM
ncbi:hypothetical protein PV797_04110 [Clostridiaceae bacterium M8S5]|nr:hypothetical protein PV797_04110 [Clostridiaceae bacterium M8S5]